MGRRVCPAVLHRVIHRFCGQGADSRNLPVQSVGTLLAATATIPEMSNDEHMDPPGQSTVSKDNIDLPIVIDLEASGFGRGSYPIEIGVALPNGDLHAWLLKPLADWTHWNDSAEGVHGISRLRLDREGIAPRTVARTLNRLLEGKTVYTDGWGVDSTWMSLLFHDTDVFQRFRLESIFTLLDQAGMDRWASAREEVLRRTSLVPHRAGSDALIVQTTYRFLTTPPDTLGCRDSFVA